MINDEIFEPIFTEDTPYNMQLLIEVSDGSYLTNTEIAQESFNLVETLSDESELSFGGCNASIFKIRVRSSVRNLLKKTLVVKQYALQEANKWIQIINDEPVVVDTITGETEELPEDSFLIGTYEVLVDRPTPDKKYRDITAYDQLYKVLNADVTLWYNSLFSTVDSITLKEMRENFLEYYHIDYEEFTGVNDTLSVGKNLGDSNISGKDVLKNICELNGCFGFITRENKFRCKILEQAIDKRYDRYIQGAIDYEEGIANAITQIALANEDNSVKVGVAGNAYLLNSNPLLSGFSQNMLVQIGERLLPIMSSCSYRPFSVRTYGDPCIEIGDYIEIPTSDTTVYSFVLNRELTGTQAMRDNLSAKGEGENGAKVTGIVPYLNTIKNNLGDKIDYIYFASVRAYELGTEWQAIARLRVAVVDSQLAQLHGIIKVNLTEPGTVYVRYLVNDEYNPFIHVMQFPVGEDTITLFLPIAVTNEVINNVRIEIMSPDAVGTIAVNDAQIVIQGVNIVKLDWDGNLDIEETYDIVIDGSMEVNYVDAVPDIDTGEVIYINATRDEYSFVIDGAMTLNYTDNVDIITRTNVFRRVTEDGAVRLTEDSKTRITEGDET